MFSRNGKIPVFVFDVSTKYHLTIKKSRANFIDKVVDLSSNKRMGKEVPVLKPALMLVLCSLALTSVMPVAVAEDVFITRTGKFYYPASSPFVRTRATLRVPREEAEARGYKPSRSYLKEKEKGSRAPAASSYEQY